MCNFIFRLFAYPIFESKIIYEKTTTLFNLLKHQIEPFLALDWINISIKSNENWVNLLDKIPNSGLDEKLPRSNRFW